MNGDHRFSRVLRAAYLLCVGLGFGACALDSSAEGYCEPEVVGDGALPEGCVRPRGGGGTAAEPEPLSVASVLADKGGQYVDGLARAGVELPRPVAAVVREFMALESFPDAFGDADVRRIRIVPGRQPGAGQFLRGGQAAITLDSLVIFEDGRFDALMGFDASFDEVVSGALTPAQDAGLFTLLHELVHVRQFRDLGRERFLSEYLADLLSRGEQAVELEQDAYSVAPGVESWSRAAVAAVR